MKNNGEFKYEWRKSLLAYMKGEKVLDPKELALFQWYASENSKVIQKMLADEREFIQHQTGADAGDVNDSGMAAVEYYIKRARYADIIYMASLLETYLTRACEKLIVVLGDHSVIFRPEELTGDKWTKRQKFLERYGGFTFPDKTWSELQTLIRVRNILVHENGSSDSISQSDRDKIEKRPGISIGTYEVVIENEYLGHCFSAFEKLAEFIDQKLNQVIDRSLQPRAMKPE